MMTDIKTAYEEICATIAAQEKEISLVAVSKGRSADDIRSLLGLGHRCFGENRVQEAATKWQTLKAEYKDVELHLIGALQTNKAREAISLFDVIETLDRPRLAATLARLRDEGLALPRLFVQVNTGDEAQKSGIALDKAETFIAQCRNEYGLVIEGLMCLPPKDAPPQPHFAHLAALAYDNHIAHLSMGMSSDYTLALASGADVIRIGTALFAPSSASN